MPTRLQSDVTKDKLTEWLANALKCELFPNEQSSLANAELPAIERVRTRMAMPSGGDETHVIALHMSDGKVFSILIKLGDYPSCVVELDSGKARRD